MKDHQTDVINYKGFHFRKRDVNEVPVSTDTHSGSLLKRILWILDNKWNPKWCYETVDILDARRLDLSFEKTGFTLIEMDQQSATANWRDPVDVQKFQNEISPKILKFFPGASRIEFGTSKVRGGDWKSRPLTDSPHLDYSQDDAAHAEFHKRYPAPKTVENQAVLGRLDTKDEEARTVIGIWKPVYMATPVGDFPLTVMDASTFKQEDERQLELHLDCGGSNVYHCLNGVPVYSPEQRWYYYSFQMEREVLLFTHYTKGKHFCNPHSSFCNPDYPENFNTRISFEMRAVIFYPKEDLAVEYITPST